MNPMEEKDLDKIAEALLAGGKMLSIHCATCGSPFFELKGKVICPTCEGREEPKPKAVPKAKPAGEIERVLRSKLGALAEELERESDRQKMAELLGLMKPIFDMLEKLKRM